MYLEEYDLDQMAVVKQGVKVEKTRSSEGSLSEPYARLVSLAEKLLMRAKQSRGLANKEIKKISSKIQGILDGWNS